eukprot:scaffold3422_cov298-Prasinococcus_capsulatus_cf.AAC.3
MQRTGCGTMSTSLRSPVTRGRLHFTYVVPLSTSASASSLQQQQQLRRDPRVAPPRNRGGVHLQIVGALRAGGVRARLAAELGEPPVLLQRGAAAAAHPSAAQGCPPCAR